MAVLSDNRISFSGRERCWLLRRTGGLRLFLFHGWSHGRPTGIVEIRKITPGSARRS